MSVAQLPDDFLPDLPVFNLLDKDLRPVIVQGIRDVVLTLLIISPDLPFIFGVFLIFFQIKNKKMDN